MYSSSFSLRFFESKAFKVSRDVGNVILLLPTETFEHLFVYPLDITLERLVKHGR